jgi:hypothetical protein
LAIIKELLINFAKKVGIDYGYIIFALVTREYSDEEPTFHIIEEFID